MFVKPAPWPDAPEDAPEKTLAVHFPGRARTDRRRLRAEGEEVPDTVFWHRRLRDGDVVLADPPAEGATS